MAIGKKGEITTAQIVTIIVLIVSFIVILYFFFRLNLGGTTNSEICHNSVVLKSKSSGLVGDLNCKTDYVCISGGGSCNDLSPTETINVDPANKEQIMKSIADQMVNCWYEFGEGKLNTADRTLLGNGDCAICSVIAFDTNVLGKNQITYEDFYNYLKNTPKDTSQTYLQYLYGVSDLDTLQNSYPLLKNNLNNPVLSGTKYAIVTGYKKGLAWGAGFWGNGNILPTYLPTDQISSQVGCTDFVTQS